MALHPTSLGRSLPVLILAPTIRRRPQEGFE
jgi:hypothetical protein